MTARARRRPDPAALALLRGSARRSARAIGVSAVCGLGFQGCMILLPWCLQRAVDGGVTAGDAAMLRRWALVFVAVSAALALSETGMRWFAALSATRTTGALVVRLERVVLGLDAATAARFGHGDLVVRATRDAEAVRDWLLVLPSLLSGLCGFATVIVVVGRSGGDLAVVGLATLPLLLLVNLWYPGRFARADGAVSAAHGDRAGAVEDLLAASTAVRGLGGERVLVDRHHEHSARVTDTTFALARVSAGWSAHAPAIPALATGVGLAVGGLAVLDGEATVGGLVAFTGWMALLARQVMMLTDRVHSCGHAYVAAVRLAEVLAARPGPPAPAGPRPLPPTGPLAGTGLRVRRDGGAALALPDVTVAEGELVAVTGPTGAGKTTLLRLLARLADPDAGAVRFGGVDLRTADPDELRDRVTLVPQRPTLVSGTIAENLRLGLPGDVPDAELLAACRAAAVDDAIAGFPDGLETVVGEHGRTLSGGQLQRLALARALLRRAPVLLLDDVTSAVDAGTEARILKRLRAWSPGTAVVAVSSRPAVLALADRVVRVTGPTGGPDGPAGPGAGELLGAGRG